MGRTITKDKYHNNRDELEKERRKLMDDVQLLTQELSEKVELETNDLEREQERNSNPDKLLKSQKEVTMNLKQDHNKIQTDITVAQNRIKDLDTRQLILNNSIADILKDKRKIDKYNMELEDKFHGRNVSDEQTKQRHKNEERKMRIKYQKMVENLKSQFVILFEKTADEEAKSKDCLEEKLKLEQELMDLKEDLEKIMKVQITEREELIKQRGKNSQLDSQQLMLDEEENLLKEENDKLLLDNEEKKKENKRLTTEIAQTIQRIEINNLLKEIDIEDLQLKAKANKEQNDNLHALVTKWNFITKEKNDV